MDSELTLRVDGAHHRLAVDTRTSLLDALRQRLGITSPKKGCDHGQCGACTVLVDGRRVLSCLALAVAHDDAVITTADSLLRACLREPVPRIPPHFNYEEITTLPTYTLTRVERGLLDRTPAPSPSRWAPVAGSSWAAAAARRTRLLLAACLRRGPQLCGERLRTGLPGLRVHGL